MYVYVLPMERDSPSRHIIVSLSPQNGALESFSGVLRGVLAPLLGRLVRSTGRDVAEGEGWMTGEVDGEEEWRDTGGLSG